MRRPHYKLYYSYQMVYKGYVTNYFRGFDLSVSEDILLLTHNQKNS